MFQEIIWIHALEWSDHEPLKKNRVWATKVPFVHSFLAGLPLDAVVAYLRKGCPGFFLWGWVRKAIRFTNEMRFHELWPDFTDDLGATSRITCLFKIRISPFCGGGGPWHKPLFSHLISNGFQGKAVPIHMSYASFCPWTSQMVDLQGGEVCDVKGSWGRRVDLFVNVFCFCFFWVGVSQWEKCI